MAKFAPKYMSCYDGPEYVFGTILLSAATFASGAAVGTAIGTLSAQADATDSAWSLVDANGNPDTTNRFRIVGNALQVGSTGVPAPGSPVAIVRETNPWVAGQFQDKSFTITVT